MIDTPDGAPRLVNLDVPTEVDDIPCKSGLIHLHENGHLSDAYVEKASTVRGWTAEPDDYVSLRADGSLKSVAFARVRTMAGQTEISGARFDATGKVEEFFRRVTATEKVSDILCTGEITFHPSGQLASACLGEALKTRHGGLPTGTCVRYDAGGTLLEATLLSPAVLDGRAFEAGAIIKFTEGNASVQTGSATFYAPFKAHDPGGSLHWLATCAWVLGGIVLLGSAALAARRVARMLRS